MQRRQLLRLLAGSALAMPFASLFPQGRVRAATAAARRVIFFYVPDGAQQADWGFGGRQLGALGDRKKDCVIFSKLDMDAADAQGHNDGAKKLLKGSLDHGTSFDQYLANTFGAATFYSHLYLGVQAHSGTKDGDGDDWFVSYRDGRPVSPEDDPANAFAKLFPNGSVPNFTPVTPPAPGTPISTPPAADPALLRDKSILDVVLADINDLRGKLSNENQRKLDLHLEATRDVERRIQVLTGTIDPTSGGSMSVPPGVVGNCDAPSLSFGAGSALYDPTRFPEILAAQMDVMVTAMACGLTRVGTVQCSRHTSPLSMPFASSKTMESHEASHNNADVFLDQCTWFFGQYKALLDRLAARQDPDVAGSTMLETTLVLFCTEINWGPSHGHTDMPFVLGGGTGGKLRSGSVYQANGRRHPDLMASIAQALGTSAQGWFGGNHSPLDGLTG